MRRFDLTAQWRAAAAILRRHFTTGKGFVVRRTGQIIAGLAARLPPAALAAPTPNQESDLETDRESDRESDQTAGLVSETAGGPDSGPAETAVDWKPRVLSDFAAWLEDLPEQPADQFQPQLEGCDLYTLLTEFVALRQEIKFQNREQHTTLRSQREFINTMTETADRFTVGLQHLATLETGMRTAAENRVLLPVLDIRDALVRGLGAARTVTAGKRFWMRRPKGIDGIVEGYEMALRRFDRALEQAGITPVGAQGEQFNPELMKAVAVGCDNTKADGLVLEVQRGGFVREPNTGTEPGVGRGCELIRTARVIVNRTGEQ